MKLLVAIEILSPSTSGADPHGPDLTTRTRANASYTPGVASDETTHWLDRQRVAHETSSDRVGPMRCESGHGHKGLVRKRSADLRDLCPRLNPRCSVDSGPRPGGAAPQRPGRAFSPECNQISPPRDCSRGRRQLVDALCRTWAARDEAPNGGHESIYAAGRRTRRVGRRHGPDSLKSTKEVTSEEALPQLLERFRDDEHSGPDACAIDLDDLRVVTQAVDPLPKLIPDSP